MKIYIMGPSGSGKSTLAKRLTVKYNIENYELDLLIYDDEHDHIKRSDEVVKKMFEDILNKDSWIIEDVGRDKFIRGREEADIIYYLLLSKFEIYKRVNKRWFEQRFMKKPYNYPPTLWQLWDSNKTAYEYLKKEKEVLKELEKYESKLKFLTKNNMKKI